MPLDGLQEFARVEQVGPELDRTRLVALADWFPGGKHSTNRVLLMVQHVLESKVGDC